MLSYNSKLLKSVYIGMRNAKTRRPSKKKKMLHFSPNYFFTTEIKKVYGPLYLLGYLPITPAHKMLHQCNIFKENSHET